MKRITKLLGLFICLFILSGCNILEDNSMNDIEIYTTVYPFNFLITYLYGNNATIKSVYPNGVNVSDYKLSDKKINEYSKSDLLVFSSLDEKERNYAVKMVNKNKDLKLIDVSMSLNITNNIEELWLNPYNYLMMAKNVKDGLNEYIDNKLITDSINTSYEELQYEISNLDASIKEMVNNANFTTILTDNNALVFLEKYGLTIITINETENIEKAKELINEGKIKYLYSLNDEENEEVNNFVTQTNIEKIYLNSMYSIDGKIESANDNYFTIMNENIELINKELEK